MPKRAATAQWREVKKRLEQLPPHGLLTFVGDLYRLSAENRRFFHARVLGGDVQLERYRELVADAMSPGSFNRPIRVAEAQRLIREFRRATGDVAGSNELTLVFIEAGTAIAANYGYGDEQFFLSLERAITSIITGLGELDPDERTATATRLRAVADRARVIGWGYGDFVREIADDLP